MVLSTEVAAKASAAAMYGVASLLIMFVNKFTLTVFAFPSFTALGLMQCIATVLLLWSLKLADVIKFPDFDRTILRRLFPLPLFFILNVLAGLGGTKRINVRGGRGCVDVVVGITRCVSWCRWPCSQSCGGLRFPSPCGSTGSC